MHTEIYRGSLRMSLRRVLMSGDSVGPFCSHLIVGAVGFIGLLVIPSESPHIGHSLPFRSSAPARTCVVCLFKRPTLNTCRNLRSCLPAYAYEANCGVDNLTSLRIITVYTRYLDHSDFSNGYHYVFDTYQVYTASTLLRVESTHTLCVVITDPFT